ncbi:MAG: hypothetical protein WC208_15605 [Gallionella sp.]
MQLSDLQKSLTDMTDEELREHLAGIRQNRRTSKRPAPAAKKAKASNAAEANTGALIAGMTKAQALQLLSIMDGKNEPG